MDVDHATAALSLDIEDGIPLGEEAQATLLAEEEVLRSLSLLATARHPDAQGEGAHRPLSPRARAQPTWAPPSENPPAGRMPAGRVTPTSARAADADGGPFEEAPLGRGAALGPPSRHAGAGGGSSAGRRRRRLLPLRTCDKEKQKPRWGPNLRDAHPKLLPGRCASHMQKWLGRGGCACTRAKSRSALFAAQP